MGEYAKNYRGERIKIGTCEDMYYLRFDQRRLVFPQSGNVDPVKDAAELRFRFPWPDEDAHEPGNFEPFRSLAVYEFSMPADVEHYGVQFRAQAGYLVSLPCPESNDKQLDGLTIHRNGFAGAVHLVSQRFRPEIGLVPVLKCGGCGAMWREEERTRIEEIAVLIRSEGDRRLAEDRRCGHANTSPETFYHQIADRVLAGITAGVQP